MYLLMVKNQKAKSSLAYKQFSSLHDLLLSFENSDFQDLRQYVASQKESLLNTRIELNMQCLSDLKVNVDDFYKTTEWVRLFKTPYKQLSTERKIGILENCNLNQYVQQYPQLDYSDWSLDEGIEGLVERLRRVARDFDGLGV